MGFIKGKVFRCDGTTAVTASQRVDLCQGGTRKYRFWTATDGSFDTNPAVDIAAGTYDVHINTATDCTSCAPLQYHTITVPAAGYPSAPYSNLDPMPRSCKAGGVVDTGCPSCQYHAWEAGKGGVCGSVLDESGKHLEKPATVEFIPMPGGGSTSIATNDAGQFAIELLAGRYEILIEGGPSDPSQVDVIAGEWSEADFQMLPPQQQQAS